MEAALSGVNYFFAALTTIISPGVLIVAEHGIE
jgi:hypothetical protein